MIPLEVLTGGVSVVGTFAMKVVGVWMQNKAEERKMLLANRGMDIEEQKALLQAPKGVAITRRIIALSIVFGVLILPKIVWWLSGGQVPVYLPSADAATTSVLFGLFSSAETVSGSQLYYGLPVFVWEGHAMMAVVGFYFGDRLAGKK